MLIAPVSEMPLPWGGMEVGGDEREAVGEFLGGIQEKSNDKEGK